MHAFIRSLVCSISLLTCSAAFAEPIDVAREFLAGLDPEHNVYHYNGQIHWQGERGLFSTYAKNEANIDCSGFVDAILQKAHSKSYDVLANKTVWKGYPKAENFYEAISHGWGFTPRANIQGIEAGDIFAVRFEPHASDTGHVMFVDVKPHLIKDREPVIANTTQWEITVIDSTSLPHGLADTRYANGEKHTGVGRGTLRLYVDAAGQVVDYVSTPKGQHLFSTKLHAVAFGKPL